MPRQQLAEFHSRLREHSELAKSFREADDLFWPAYREHVVWRYNSESETSDILISSFNWDSMRQDRQFIMIAIGALRNQLVIQQSLVSLSDQSRSVCRAVADLIGQRCEALD